MLILYSILISKPFKFIVGPEKQEFTLHAEVISRLSTSLNTLINGGMKEAAEGVAVWEDIDAETFIRLSKFAYTGDYDPPRAALGCQQQLGEGCRRRGKPWKRRAFLPEGLYRRLYRWHQQRVGERRMGMGA